MILHLHRCGPPLDRFVELVTYYADYQPTHRMEKLLPDGAVEIVIDLTDTPKRMFNHDLTEQRSFRNAWISGMRRGWILIEAAPGSSMVVIRFRPGGAYPFLGFSVDGITDTVDPLDDVLGRATASLRDRVLSAETHPDKMAAVEKWLLERATGRLESHAAVEYVTQRLFAPAGIRISDLVDEVGYSQRYLTGLFRRWVGLPPKHYGRIRRFQEVLRDVTRQTAPAGPDYGTDYRGGTPPEPDWADLALQHGYYDQSHLVRDFRDFSGLSPTGYVSAYRGLENYLPVE
ncbi:MAG: AraC family transcriptional regulator [bacterium]|nr:AraC family transcriptional regulator [bacterium]